MIIIIIIIIIVIRTHQLCEDCPFNLELAGPRTPGALNPESTDLIWQSTRWFSACSKHSTTLASISPNSPLRCSASCPQSLKRDHRFYLGLLYR